MSVTAPVSGAPQLPSSLRMQRWLVRNHQPLIATCLFAFAALIYRLTVSTLMDNLSLDTPLAYLPLLPFISLGLALHVILRHRNSPAPARDRLVDAVIAIPLLVLALFLITVVPALSSTYYWSDRPDVLSFGCFVAGSIIIAFGTGWFWRLRWPVVFLLLAWPALYLRYLSDVLLSFTNATNAALAAIVPHLGLGVSRGTGEGVLLVAQAHGAPISVNVSTACAGAEGVLGFALVGAAFLTTRSGRPSRRMLWLLFGMVFEFGMNLVRITSVLALCAAGYPGLALGGYHAVIGTILFTVVVGVMATLTRRFGLTAPGAVTVDEKPPSIRQLGTKAKTGAIATFAAFTLLIAFADASLAPYAAFADGSGAPTVAPFASAARPASYSVTHVADYPWAAQYFGKGSSFERYSVQDGANHFAYADVVRTKNKAALATYNVQNCFLFHRYHIDNTQRVGLGAGVTGLLLDYTVEDTHARWSTLSWAWPVRVGTETYYERILLTTSTAATGMTPTAATALRTANPTSDWVLRAVDVVMGTHNSTGGAAAKGADSTLSAFGRQLVDAALRARLP